MALAEMECAINSGEVDKSRLEKLERCSNILACLEAGGVDNYDISLEGLA